MSGPGVTTAAGNIRSLSWGNVRTCPTRALPRTATVPRRVASGFAMLCVVAAMAASPDRALACTGDPIEGALSAEFVIAGPVVAVEPATNYDPRLRAFIVTVQPDRYLKGDGEALIHFRVHGGTSCSFSVNPNDYFVGVLHRWPDGMPSAGSLSVWALGSDQNDAEVAAAIADLEQILSGGFSGTITGGSVPSSGFGLIVFDGGTSGQLIQASGCTTERLAFWATTPIGEFVTYVPGTSVGAVNAACWAMFPRFIPANTALLARCA